MTTPRTFQTSTDRVHTSGELAGEPVASSARAPRVILEPAPELPLTARARAAAMGWGLSRKLLEGGAYDAGPGQVPSSGTPGTLPKVPGRALDVVAASRQIPDSATTWSFLAEAGQILPPPYDPILLCQAVGESETLPAAVDAMAVNIGGHGYELVPLFDTKDPTTGQELEVPAEAKAERSALLLFLAAAHQEGLEALIDKVDRDVETMGWGAIEVLRDRTGREASLEHVPAATVRMGPEGLPVLVEEPIRHPDSGELVIVQRWRRFRLFVQVKEGRTVFFKSYADPRHVNWRNGAIQAEPWGTDPEGNSLEATELVIRRIYDPSTPYGVPRWIGSIPHVRAARSAAELVVDWFDNAPIGVKLLMVAGGTWRPSSTADLADKLNGGARGRDHAWDVIPIEAETAATGDPLDETKDAPPRMALESLATELPTGIYQGRDSLLGQAPTRIRAAFRLGGIYFGDSEAESNRAAADTARAIGEEQVFTPIRRGRWEALFNRVIFPRMGINLWAFKIKGATTGDDTAALASLGPMVQAGGISPNAMARLYSKITGEAVTLITEPWGDRPLSLTVALLAATLDPNKPLGELVAEAAAKADAAAEADRQAKAEAAEATAAAGGAPGGPPPPGGKGKPPAPGGKPGKPGPVVKSLVTGNHLAELLALREALVAELGAEASALEASPHLGV
jgi:capsid portal protein